MLCLNNSSVEYFHDCLNKNEGVISFYGIVVPLIISLIVYSFNKLRINKENKQKKIDLLRLIGQDLHLIVTDSNRYLEPLKNTGILETVNPILLKSKYLEISLSRNISILFDSRLEEFIAEIVELISIINLVQAKRIDLICKGLNSLEMQNCILYNFTDILNTINKTLTHLKEKYDIIIPEYKYTTFEENQKQ